jgi:hypothetical protein
MKKLYLAILFLSLIFSVKLNAKNILSDLRSGYIITLNGDTIFGSVLYRESSAVYSFCTFSNAGKEKKYYPGDIKEYGINNGKVYTSQILKDSFVEILMIGNISFYISENDFFLKKNTEDLIRLKNVRNSNIVDAKLILRYKGILAYLVSDILSKKRSYIFDNDFNEFTVADVIADYNKACNSDGAKVYMKKPKLNVKFGVSAGVSRSNLKVVNSFYPYGAGNPINQNVYFNGTGLDLGIRLNLSLPNLSERLSIQPEFHFYKSVNMKGGSKNVYDYTIISYKNIVSEIPLSVKYIIPVGECMFDVFLGCSYITGINSYIKFKGDENTYTKNFQTLSSMISDFCGCELSRKFDFATIGTEFRFYNYMLKKDFASGVYLHNMSLSVTVVPDFKIFKK